MSRKTNLYLITYDISEDGPRRKVSQRLEDLGGRRINYSVFECLLTAQQAERLMLALVEEVDAQTDSLACYAICRACYTRSWWWPAPPGPWPDAIFEV